MLRVVALGTLATDPRFFRQNARGVLPYPVGYTVERNVFNSDIGDSRHPRTKVLLPGEAGSSEHLPVLYYTASIRKGQDGGPVFEVRRSDKPEEVHSGNNPSAPWRMAFEAAERDFPDRSMDLVKGNRDDGTMLVWGQNWYGLQLRSVLAQLRTLPGAKVIFGKGAGPSASKGGKKPKERASLSVSAINKNSGSVSPKKNAEELSQQSTVKSRITSPDKPLRDGKINNNITSVMADDVPLAVLAAGKAMGVVNRCRDCGLSSVFCPLTGKPHLVEGKAPQAPTLPGKRARGQQKGAPVSKDGDKIQQRVSRKRERVDDTKQGDTSTGVASGEVTRKSVTRRRTSKGDEQSTSTPPQTKKRQLKLGSPVSESVSADPDEVPLIARFIGKNGDARMKSSEQPPPPPPPPPPSPAPAPLWRPPIEASESNKALQLLQRMLRGEDTAHVPFASMLHLPQVAVTKTSGMKKAKKEEDDDDDDDPFADLFEADAGNIVGEDTGAAAAAPNGGSGGTSTRQGKNKKPDDVKGRHPLDITEVATSVSGKRYVKFMQLYTSERAKLDLLKKANELPVVPRTRGTIKRRTEMDGGIDSASHTPSALPPPVETESGGTE